ncbi:MAG: hypothetical protein KJ856_10200 [Gammaproteobacteria bacterium]|nr:hypothetical protein [Gammaproteobacteria bacterium]MBU1479395.1 hypothetical protein [Gammaproteobacteria bacterium]MBU2002103.1 hypothetical protein [Gammaproteobacteria bacterium]MBU2133226.1 hypothetical protein [Gammaproteobacteria bacterium]MBU2187370.1 hypothetical protein [Gammaproteobacteria bacterium]
MTTKRKDVKAENYQDFDFKAGKVRMNKYAQLTKGTFVSALRSCSNKNDFSGRLAGKSLKNA